MTLVATPVATPKQRPRIVVADDNPANRDQKSLVVEAAGYDPRPLGGPYHTVQDLLDAIKREDGDALLCDNKLNEGNYAGFRGVEAVAKLYGTTTPAILVTDYMEGDLLEAIRKHRRYVPVLIKGAELRPRTLKEGLETWKREVIHHERPVERRPRRAFVRIVDIVDGVEGRSIRVSIPRWREDETIVLRAELIPTEFRTQLKPGTVLIASVNTEATRSEDLFFEDFEVVPPEDLSDDTSP